jgi:hydroxymethylpyrimidine/phosphomethylpyrimidine kinase
MRSQFPAVLTIGASDPTGSGGVQADLKAFAAFGAYGACAITGIQSRSGADVSSLPLSQEQVAAQIDSAVSGVAVQAVKTGSLCSEEIASLVFSKIKEHGLGNIVVDPVDFEGEDESGGLSGLRAVLKADLLPAATMATPNIEEASAIAGVRIRNTMGMKAGAKLIHQMGAKYVVVTGGLFEEDQVVDYLFDGGEYMDLPSEKVESESLGGIGASFASAIAAGLAYDRSPEEAVAIAKMFATDTALNGLTLKGGEVAVNQLHAWWAAGGERGYGA